MNEHRRAPSPRAALVGFITTVVLALWACAATRGGAQAVVFVVVALLPVIAIPFGLRAHRVRQPLAWHAITVMVALLAVANTIWAAGKLWGSTPVADLLYSGIYPVAYLGLLAAAGLLVAQRAPHDAGRVIDAALVGICGAGMLWEWLLRPGLAGYYQDPVNRIFVLVSTLALMAALGALLHVTTSIDPGRPSLALLLLSLSSTLVGNVIDELGHATMTMELWIIAYLSLGAAALHPAAAHVTAPTDEESDPVTSGRLLRMGLILAVIPLVGGVPQLFGQSPDGLLLTVGTLMTIPLVLVRVGQLGRQRQEAQQALAHQAAHDELTGLPNRRTVLDQLERAVEQFNAGGLDELTVLFCDLDGFKPINDGLGHQVGDGVLRIAATRLRDCVRSGDLVGRFGGDEFLIVCRNRGGDEVVSRVEHVFDDPLVVSKGPVRLGISVGVARTSPGTPATADALVATADQAMYAVKRARHTAAR